MVINAMQVPLQHMQQKLSAPGYRLYELDFEWRVVPKDEDHLRDTEWIHRGWMSFDRSTDRYGFWALTKEKTRPVNMSWTRGVTLIDRPRKPMMQSLLGEAWWMDREYYGATPLDGLITDAVNNPPHYTAERILWTGYVHNTFTVLSVLGILVGTPMALLSTRRWIRECKRNRQGCCKSCGYSLSGLPNDAPCPECGLSPGVGEP